MHEMRRKDRQIEQPEINEILKNREYGILSTIGEDGFPYGVPLNYVYEEGRLYFHSAAQGHKLENLNYSRKASFCVTGETEVLPESFSTRYESVILFGEIRELTGKEKAAALMKIVDRFSHEFREKGEKYVQGSDAQVRVFCLETERVTGKARR